MAAYGYLTDGDEPVTEYLETLIPFIDGSDARFARYLERLIEGGCDISRFTSEALRTEYEAR